jgi:hypothetical protein
MHMQVKLGIAYLQRLRPDRSSEDLRGVLLGSLAEVFEHAGAHLPAGHVAEVIEVLFNEVASEAPTNRHHAVFALGHLVRGLLRIHQRSCTAIDQCAVAGSRPYVLDVPQSARA